ncbi:hypothetical protein BDZ89DRAFT_1142751 [Hymenopellis radicata]|nr:hypothetical protein BDZ89DRAFT_1142751 [Hymenopellis radicata]
MPVLSSANSALPMFPQELIDEIVDWVAASSWQKHDLKSCALVTRSFRQPTLRHLFSVLDAARLLPTPEQWRHFRNMLIAAPHVAQSYREMRLDGERLPSTEILLVEDVVSLLPKIERLFLTRVESRHLSPRIRSAVGLMPITTFGTENGELGRVSQLATLRRECLGRLEHLQLDAKMFMDDRDVIPASISGPNTSMCRRPSLLKTISLVSYQISSILTAILDGLMGDLDCLEVLEFRCVDFGRDTTLLPRLLCGTPSLRRLSLLFGPQWLGPRPCLLYSIQNIEMCTSNILWLVESLSLHSSHSPSQLTSIVIRLSPSISESHFPAEDWRRFDEVVSDASELLRLQLINFRRLKALDAHADFVLVYPQEWTSWSAWLAGRPNENIKTMLRILEYRFGVQLHPVDILEVRIGVRTWKESLTKLYILGMTEYRRIVYLDNDGLVLKNMEYVFSIALSISVRFNSLLLASSHLFLEPPAPLLLPRAYWMPNKPFATHIMVIEPSKDLWQDVTTYLATSPQRVYDMEVGSSLASFSEK